MSNNVLLLYFLINIEKFVYIMKIKGPFVKLVMFEETPTQFLSSFTQIKTQNKKI
jgi:hypothetical protein